MIQSNVLRAAGLALAAALFTGCATTPRTDPASDLGIRAAEHALRMVGKPYRYGGSTPRGFDCSGLVRYSYRKAGAMLPRSTSELHRASRAVGRAHMRRGDLLFFDQEGKRSSHVAIYLGDGRFVHAPSTGKRVLVANLSDPYWIKHYVGARRPHAVD